MNEGGFERKNIDIHFIILLQREKDRERLWENVSGSSSGLRDCRPRRYGQTIQEKFRIKKQFNISNYFIQNSKYSIHDNPRLWWLLHRILQLDHDQNFLFHIWTSILMLNPSSLLTSLDEDNERLLVVNSQGDTELDSVRWEYISWIEILLFSEEILLIIRPFITGTSWTRFRTWFDPPCLCCVSVNVNNKDFDVLFNFFFN